MAEWVKVGDGFPNHLEKVLVYDEMGNMQTAIFLNCGNGIVDWCTPVRLNRQVTHWQPLPQSPRTPKERGGEK